MIAQKEMLPNYTYADYLLWEGKWELINGIPYALSPSPVRKHQRIASALGGEFYAVLKGCPGCHVYQQLDYKVSENIVLQPDVLVVCGNIEEKKYIDFAPSVVAEILSPSTALKDKHIKFPIYEGCGIRYFILVSPEKETAEIYEIQNGEYELRAKGKDVAYDFLLDNDCSARISFKEIW